MTSLKAQFAKLFQDKANHTKEDIKQRPQAMKREEQLITQFTQLIAGATRMSSLRTPNFPFDQITSSQLKKLKEYIQDLDKHTRRLGSLIQLSHDYVKEFVAKRESDHCLSIRLRIKYLEMEARDMLEYYNQVYIDLDDNPKDIAEQWPQEELSDFDLSPPVQTWYDPIILAVQIRKLFRTQTYWRESLIPLLQHRGLPLGTVNYLTQEQRESDFWKAVTGLDHLITPYCEEICSRQHYRGLTAEMAVPGYIQYLFLHLGWLDELVESVFVMSLMSFIPWLNLIYTEMNVHNTRKAHFIHGDLYSAILRHCSLTIVDDRPRHSNDLEKVNMIFRHLLPASGLKFFNPIDKTKEFFSVGLENVPMMSPTTSTIIYKQIAGVSNEVHPYVLLEFSAINPPDLFRDKSHLCREAFNLLEDFFDSQAFINLSMLMLGPDRIPNRIEMCAEVATRALEISNEEKDKAYILIATENREEILKFFLWAMRGQDAV